MMSLIEFLCETECRTQEYEGFELYSLQYRNRSFSIKRGEMDNDSIASFYLRKDSKTPSAFAEGDEVFRECFIQKEIYSSDVVSAEGNEFVKDLLDMMSKSCKCASDCTMESGCTIMHQLLSLKCRINWEIDWPDQLLEVAEDRVMEWIYGT